MLFWIRSPPGDALFQGQRREHGRGEAFGDHGSHAAGVGAGRGFFDPEAHDWDANEEDQEGHGEAEGDPPKVLELDGQSDVDEEESAYVIFLREECRFSALLTKWNLGAIGN